MSKSKKKKKKKNEEKILMQSQITFIYYINSLFEKFHFD